MISTPLNTAKLQKTGTVRLNSFMQRSALAASIQTANKVTRTNMKHGCRNSGYLPQESFDMISSLVAQMK